MTGILIGMLTGCRQEMPIFTESPIVEPFTKEQILLVAQTQAIEYRDRYGEEIMSATISEGKKFSEFLLDEVKVFFKDIKGINQFAIHLELELTSEEEEQLQILARTYFDSLSEVEIAELGLEQEDVLQLYEQYYIAEKTVNEITKDINLEISDEEARVMIVEQIRVDDLSKAEEILNLLQGGEVEFSQIALENSQGEIGNIEIGKGEFEESFEAVAFELKDGEISSVIQVDQEYYIIKCINDYDEDATLERKERLAIQRKEQVFRQEYQLFLQENPIDSQEELWGEINIDSKSEFHNTQLFSMYYEFMNP